MSARKAAPSDLDNAKIGREQAKAAERRDEAADEAAKPKRDYRGQLGRTAKQRREIYGLMSGEELLAVARAAAALELRGAKYADARPEVAAAIVALVLESLPTLDVGRWNETEQRRRPQAQMPRRDAKRVQIGRLCGDAKNLRRKIDLERDRLKTEADEQRAAQAIEPGAMQRASSTYAAQTLDYGRRTPATARAAAGAMVRRLGLPRFNASGRASTTDDECLGWTVFYCWARGADVADATLAAELDISVTVLAHRKSREAKFIRGFWGDSPAALLRLVSFGAVDGTTTEGERIVTIGVADDSDKEKGDVTKQLADAPGAPHWREPHFDRPVEITDARAVCDWRIDRSVKLHPNTARANRRKLDAKQRAASLRRLGLAIAAGESRRELGVQSHSDLVTAMRASTFLR